MAITKFKDTDAFTTTTFNNKIDEINQGFSSIKGEQVDVSSVASSIGESSPLTVDGALTSLYTTATNKSGFPKIATTIEPGRINSDMSSVTTYYSYTLPFAKTLEKMPSMIFLDIGRESKENWSSYVTTFTAGYNCMHNVRMFLIRQDDGTFNAYVWGAKMSNAPFIPTSSGTTYDYSKNNVAFGFSYLMNVGKLPSSTSDKGIFYFTYQGNNDSTFSMFGGTSFFSQYPHSAKSNPVVFYIGAFSYDLSGVTFYMWYGSQKSDTNYNLIDYRGIVYE